MSTDQVYRFTLPHEGESLRDWMSKYGKAITLKELGILIRRKGAKIPKGYFIVWAHSPLLGPYSGWLFDEVYSVRVLWQSTTAGNIRQAMSVTGEWYYIERTLALPYTDAPVF